MIALATILAGVLAPLPAAAQTICSPTINSCGCVITAPGSYKIGLNLSASLGLTSDNACIAISSSFVFLDAGKKTITGTMTTPRTDVGILARKKVNTIFLEGRAATLTGWDVGLLIQSATSVIDSFNATSNGAAVTNNTLGGGAHNGKFDLFDANSNCGTNRWISNDPTATVSPSTCVK